MKLYGGTKAGLLIRATIGGFEPGSARALCSDHSGVAATGPRTERKDRNIKVDLSNSDTTLKGGGQAAGSSAPAIVTPAIGVLKDTEVMACRSNKVVEQWGEVTLCANP